MKNKGTIIALAVILAAALGLYFAYLNQDLQGTGLPATTSAPVDEFWQTSQRSSTSKTTGTAASNPASATAATAPPAGSSTTAASTQAATTTKSTTKNSDYPYDYPGVAPAVAAKPSDPYLILVSRSYALPANYSFDRETLIKTYPEADWRELEVNAAKQYQAMYAAALKEGAELVPYSGYRSTQRQKNNFDNKIASYVSQGYSRTQAILLAAESILPPGCSEHEAGLAIDITRPGVWNAVESFADSKEFTWLQAHAQDYGFILRYPADKTTITGVKYEPWHWRYVGVENAKKIKASGKCLEEYLGISNNF